MDKFFIHPYYLLEYLLLCLVYFSVLFIPPFLFFFLKSMLLKLKSWYENLEMSQISYWIHWFWSIDRRKWVLGISSVYYEWYSITQQEKKMKRSCNESPLIAFCSFLLLSGVVSLFVMKRVVVPLLKHPCHVTRSRLHLLPHQWCS